VKDDYSGIKMLEKSKEFF